MLITKETVEHVFTYHTPSGDQSTRYSVIRNTARSLAHTILDNTPVSPEQTLALRRLQEVVMWANASIAINT